MKNPNSRPFLGQLYRASERARACGSVRLSDSQVKDLNLWEVFVDAAADGILMNHRVFRWPSWIVCMNACPQGIGGYGLQSGIAWRLLLPPDWIGRGFLNCLTLLAVPVGVWVQHQAGGPWAEDEVLLCLGIVCRRPGGSRIRVLGMSVPSTLPLRGRRQSA